MRIVQKLESLNSYRLRGQPVTLSFWVRFSNATISSISNSGGGGESTYGNFGYSIGSYTSTTDSATNTSAADAATTASITNGSLPTTWTKYTLTGTISSTANNVDVLFAFASLGSTTSADTEWFELAQIQLEVGTIATPFEFEDFGTTLSKCQRYCYVIGPSNNGYAPMAFTGSMRSATTAMFQTRLPQNMRGVPTVTVDAAGNFTIDDGPSVYTPSVFALDRYSTNALMMYATVSGATAGRGVVVYGNAGGAGVITVSSEL
jgi:hypothetical protein